MLVKTTAIRRMFIAAGLIAFAATANAFGLGLDPQIQIDRTVGSSALNIRYKGVSAALVELRINGTSVGTRALDGSTNAGETNFTINLGDLHEGDNLVEVHIFDRTGKMVAQDKTNISVASSQQGPVYLTAPKTGATVQGPVEIKLGIDENLKDVYVSFFVDGNFKAITNSAPFSYTWDTEVETNGWHDLEAWAIDDASTTHKTGKVKVFVNNPHGDTRRPGTSYDQTPTLPAASNSTTVLPIHLTPKPKISLTKTLKPAFVKSTTGLPALPPVVPTNELLGKASMTKPPMRLASGIVMGPRPMLPTGNRNVQAAAQVKTTGVAVNNDHPGMVIDIRRHDDRVATTATSSVSSVIPKISSTVGLIDVTQGTRLPNLSSFYIALDSDLVDFHGVMPRVDDGVPMTPLRFLLEKKGGSVSWDNLMKTVFAKADGNSLKVHIGDPFAMVNDGSVSLERPSYLDRGRTIVPLTFIEKACKVNLQYDKNSHHVLITSQDK